MSRRILVLDDDPNVLTLLRTYFGGLGWHVETSADAAAGLSLADSDAPFDAVICDLHFTPAHVGEGYEVIAKPSPLARLRDAVLGEMKKR